MRTLWADRRAYPVDRIKYAPTKHPPCAASVMQWGPAASSPHVLTSFVVLCHLWCDWDGIELLMPACLLR
jgi:hypothetical protein